MKNQPELHERLDTVATQGRSLGVHLLLATQSPTGVITNAIRTNTNLWLCLRGRGGRRIVGAARQAGCSQDPDRSAGPRLPADGRERLDRRLPGPRIARDVDDGVALAVDVAPFADDAPPTTPVSPAVSVSGRRTTELSVVSAMIAATAAAEARPPQRPLWSAPLALQLDPATIPPVAATTGHLVGAWGMTDLPHQQRQSAAAVDLTATGNALVVGVLGAGVSTALRQLCFDLATRRSPGDLHIAAIDAGAGSLADLTRLPHCAGVIGAGDHERVVRLIDRLHRQLDERAAAMATSGTNSFIAWRRDQPDPPPWQVLLIDDFAALRQWLDNETQGVADRFSTILRGGPAAGIHTVIGASQTTDVKLSQLNLVNHRIVLRAADALDYQLLDVRIRLERTTHWPPGRGMVAGGFSVQVALPPPTAAADVAARWVGIDRRLLPRSVRRLPLEVELADLGEGVTTAGELPLGLGGADCDPVTVDFERTNNTLLVVGPSQSGRSTALSSLMASALAAERGLRIRLIAPRRSPLRTLGDHPSVDVVAETPDRIAAALADLADHSGPPLMVLVDDAESLAGTSVPLEQAMRRAPDTGVRFAVRGAHL